MLDTLLFPFRDLLLSALGLDVFEPNVIFEFGAAVGEWILRAIQVLNDMLHDVCHALRLHLSFVWTIIQWCLAAGRDLHHSLILAGCEASRLFIAFVHAFCPILRTISLHLITSLGDTFRPLFRNIFDFLHPLVCQEIPIARSSFWNPFPKSSCSAEDVKDSQRECAFAISSVFAVAALVVVSTVTIVAACCLRRRKERAVCVDRGTNTPVLGGNGDASTAMAPIENDCAGTVAKEDQFR